MEAHVETTSDVSDELHHNINGWVFGVTRKCPHIDTHSFLTTTRTKQNLPIEHLAVMVEPSSLGDHRWGDSRIASHLLFQGPNTDWTMKVGSGMVR